MELIEWLEINEIKLLCYVKCGPNTKNLKNSIQINLIWLKFFDFWFIFSTIFINQIKKTSFFTHFWNKWDENVSFLIAASFHSFKNKNKSYSSFWTHEILNLFKIEVSEKRSIITVILANLKADFMIEKNKNKTYEWASHKKNLTFWILFKNEKRWVFRKM